MAGSTLDEVLGDSNFYLPLVVAENTVVALHVIGGEHIVGVVD